MHSYRFIKFYSAQYRKPFVLVLHELVVIVILAVVGLILYAL